MKARLRMTGQAEGLGVLFGLIAELFAPVEPVPVVTHAHADRAPAGDVLDAQQCTRCGVWTVGPCEDCPGRVAIG